LIAAKKLLKSKIFQHKQQLITEIKYKLINAIADSKAEKHADGAKKII
jgi:hypothetical protein